MNHDRLARIAALADQGVKPARIAADLRAPIKMVTRTIAIVRRARAGEETSSIAKALEVSQSLVRQIRMVAGVPGLKHSGPVSRESRPIVPGAAQMTARRWEEQRAINARPAERAWCAPRKRRRAAVARTAR